MQPQFAALLACSKGVSKISESIWSGRFKYAAELNKMGANIDVIGNEAIINGVPLLEGADVKASDLRAGACLVIAGLAANGVTTVSNVEYIDRGYEDLIDKLKRLGADIKRV
jgi:UDP-N-acetylglucosamine 1-carboxyvinyltransferase